MKLIASVCYFIAIFGATWMVCVRASDWNTSRWSDGKRAMMLVFGAAAWVVALVWLGDQLFIGNLGRSDVVAIASLSGFLASILLYLLAAYRR